MRKLILLAIALTAFSGSAWAKSAKVICHSASSRHYFSENNINTLTEGLNEKIANVPIDPDKNIVGTSAPELVITSGSDVSVYATICVTVQFE